MAKPPFAAQLCILIGNGLGSRQSLLTVRFALKSPFSPSSGTVSHQPTALCNHPKDLLLFLTGFNIHGVRIIRTGAFVNRFQKNISDLSTINKKPSRCISNARKFCGYSTEVHGQMISQQIFKHTQRLPEWRKRFSSCSSSRDMHLAFSIS